MRNIKFLAASPQPLADLRQVRVIASTGAVDREGDVINQNGIDVSAYMGNPVVLWQHDPEQPIARCLRVESSGNATQALIQFPDAGLVPKADEIYNLVKAGIVNTVSIGFSPLAQEPIDPSRPYGPQRYTRLDLLEISFVAVPANSGAVVIERGLKSGRTISADTKERLQEVHRVASSVPDMLNEIMNLDDDSMRYPDEQRSTDWVSRQIALLDLGGEAMGQSAWRTRIKTLRRHVMGMRASADFRSRCLRRIDALEMKFPPGLSLSATAKRRRQEEAIRFGNAP